MIPNSFEYQRATSLDDAIAKLRAAKGDAKFIAGGHSLIPVMKMRLAEPKVLIDIARIPGFSGIKKAGDKIEIGAGTIHHEVATSALLRKECPVISDAAATIGDPQVRNRGTLGGSLAHSDPAADYPAAMLAADAEIHLKGPKGSRVVKAQDFFRGLFSVDLGEDELIAAVQFNPAKASAYSKLYQRASHYAIVGVAAVVDASGGTIRSARIGLTGAGPYATRLSDVEKALAGKPLSDATLDGATKQAGAAIEDVNADIHGSSDYRRAMIGVFAKRALKAAMARA